MEIAAKANSATDPKEYEPILKSFQFADKRGKI